MQRRLREVYKLGALHTVRVLLGADSFADLLNRYHYVKMIASYDRALVDRVGRLESDLRSRDKELQANMVDLARLRSAQLTELGELRSVESKRQDAVASFRGAENRAHNYALISMGFAAAGLIGPTTAGLAIDHFGHLPTFVLLSAFLLGPILLLWLKPDIVPRPGARSAADNARSMLDLWRAPVLRNTFVASGIISSAWDLFQFYLPVYGHSIGLSASAIGAMVRASAPPSGRGRKPIP